MAVSVSHAVSWESSSVLSNQQVASQWCWVQGGRWRLWNIKFLLMSNISERTSLWKLSSYIKKEKYFFLLSCGCWFWQNDPWDAGCKTWCTAVNMTLFVSKNSNKSSPAQTTLRLTPFRVADWSSFLWECLSSATHNNAMLRWARDVDKHKLTARSHPHHCCKGNKTANVILATCERRWLPSMINPFWYRCRKLTNEPTVCSSILINISLYKFFDAFIHSFCLSSFLFICPYFPLKFAAPHCTEGLWFFSPPVDKEQPPSSNGLYRKGAVCFLASKLYLRHGKMSLYGDLD